MRTEDQIRGDVRRRYAEAATQDAGCCGATADSQRLGYETVELSAIPVEADLGLGCGNPVALASLQSGQVVLDLGSGGGIDCFLAARRVGPEGRVIGVDMTPEMISRARDSAEQHGYDNVEFRLGEIEHLPVADGSVDVILSNCVINLSPDKRAVFREAFRVLRPGGRLAVSDVVALRPLPPEARDDPVLYAGCVGGAATIDDLTGWLSEAGFENIRIRPMARSEEIVHDWAPGTGLELDVASAEIEATKPGPGS